MQTRRSCTQIGHDRGHAPRKKKKKKNDDVLAWKCGMTTKSEIVTHNILYTDRDNDKLVCLKDITVSLPYPIFKPFLIMSITAGLTVVPAACENTALC